LGQFVDPAISQAKFDREIAAYRVAQKRHSRRGWWLVEAEFPIVVVAFISPKLKPSMVTFAIRVDFTNYDVWAPSVTFVDVFTREPVLMGQTFSLLPRIDPGTTPETLTAAAEGRAQVMVNNLLQGYLGKPVFLCLQGVREYHDNPAHTGDNWLLYRGTGRGTLYNILDMISRYGSEPLDHVQVQMKPVQTGIPQ
jgi:hypothetical protein